MTFPSILENIILDLPKLFHSTNLFITCPGQAFNFLNHDTGRHYSILLLEHLSKGNNCSYKFFYTHRPIQGSKILSSSPTKLNKIQYLCVIDSSRVDINLKDIITIPLLPTVASLAQDIIFTELDMGGPTSCKLNTSIGDYLRLAELDLYNYYYGYQRNLCNNLYDKGCSDSQVWDALLRINGALSEASYIKGGSDFLLYGEREIVLTYLSDYTIKLK